MIVESGLKRSILFLSLWVAAQASLASELAGVVRDSKGQPVARAKIDVVGSNIQVQANERGEFVLDNLPNASIELHVKAPGFNHSNVEVYPGEEPLLQLQLTRSSMEVIDVVSLPWHASVLESALPVNVLTSDALRNKQGSTLGETLHNEVGIHTNYYGPVSSSPIIRGLDGPRVLVMQNNLDSGDASRVGPDHAVATEASTAEQIEVLRGPATLFYGSGAIGGVVNIIDDRVPQSNLTQGEWLIQHNDVADENLISSSLTTGADQFAVHVDGFWRQSNNYRIPVPAEANGHGERRLLDSAQKSHGYNIGGSYLLSQGFAGISYGRLNRTYGIPGHSHEHEHEHEHEHPDDEHVYADLRQDRLQFQSELTLNHVLFSSANTRLGYTDYTHHEIEHGEILTTFDSKTYEGRFELFHHPIAKWRGALSLHYKYQDTAAEGVEAFTPPSTTETMAVALIEERHFGDIQVQLGMRVERLEISADHVATQQHNHGNDHSALTSTPSVTHVIHPISLSAGGVWDFTPGYNMGLSLSHAQRGPSAAELFSFGAHIGTGSFEVGHSFELHDEGNGDYHFELNISTPALERSNNIDISLRKLDGPVGFTLNAFYNRIDNFYYLQETGLIADQDNDHGHSHDGDGFPLRVFAARDANLYGFEGELTWQINTPLKATVFSDYTRAQLRNDDDLPRIPPLRLGGQIHHDWGGYSAELQATHYFEQTKIGALESATPGYTLVDARLGYHRSVAGQDLTFYLQGSNLTNEEARPHTSFLKEIAPLPARAITVGVRSSF